MKGNQGKRVKRCSNNVAMITRSKNPLVWAENHMRVSEVCEIRRVVIGLVFLCLYIPGMNGQKASNYGPSLDSLNHHPLPQWYAAAKLGIFFPWVFFPLPGWAPPFSPGNFFSPEE